VSRKKPWDEKKARDQAIPHCGRTIIAEKKAEKNTGGEKGVNSKRQRKYSEEGIRKSEKEFNEGKESSPGKTDPNSMRKEEEGNSYLDRKRGGEISLGEGKRGLEAQTWNEMTLR